MPQNTLREHWRALGEAVSTMHPSVYRESLDFQRTIREVAEAKATVDRERTERPWAPSAELAAVMALSKVEQPQQQRAAVFDATPHLGYLEPEQRANISARRGLDVMDARAQTPAHELAPIQRHKRARTR
jgi:hypothetical protein